MNAAIDKLYRKCKAKARALLRCRKCFGLYDLLCLFKTHVRMQIEWCNGAIYHAAPTLLRRLDAVQHSFLQHLGMSECVAFRTFKLAPLQLRHDIGMLGVLWKVAHRCGYKFLAEMFPMS